MEVGGEGDRREGGREYGTGRRERGEGRYKGRESWMSGR